MHCYQGSRWSRREHTQGHRASYDCWVVRLDSLCLLKKLKKEKRTGKEKEKERGCESSKHTYP